MAPRSHPPLRDYQQTGVDFLRTHPRALLADEMGLGKSSQLIIASKGRTLVVAPAMVLDGGTWTDEIDKWADDPSRFETVAYSMLSVYSHTIERDRKKVRVYQLRDEWAQHWDTVIFDEAHYLKGRKAVRTEQSMLLADRSDQVFLATGTPIPNYAHELFNLLQILNPDEARPGRKYGSYWRWAGQWFSVFSTVHAQYNIGPLKRCVPQCATRPPTDPCAHYLEFAEANLGEQFLMRRREDVLKDLPLLTEIEVHTPMGPKQRSSYKAMKRDMVAETLDGNLVVSWSSSAKHVRLDRMTSGLSMLDEQAPLPAKFDVNDSKFVRLAADLQDRSRPTLVMAHYHKTVEACLQVALSLGLRARLVYGPTPKAERLAAIRAFQAGDLDVLVGSLETLAEGLTLTAADMVIFVEKSFKPSRNEQALRRIHRIGQERPCIAVDYVTPDSIDEGKRELLKTKTDHQIATLTAAQMLRYA